MKSRNTSEVPQKIFLWSAIGAVVLILLGGFTGVLVSRGSIDERVLGSLGVMFTMGMFDWDGPQEISIILWAIGWLVGVLIVVSGISLFLSLVMRSKL